MRRPSFFRLLLVFPVCLLLGSCGRAPAMSEIPTSAPEPEIQSVAEVETGFADVAPVWQPLLEKLLSDGIQGAEVNYLFVRLGDNLSQEPMGRKVHELYNSKFLPKPKGSISGDTPPKGSNVPGPWYKGIVTEANARRCRNFINNNADAFARAEKTYGVPAEVAAALLFVETRLGDYLGKENVFITLASMSASTEPTAIPDWLTRLPGAETRLDWISERMADKSSWAYTELRALISYSLANGVDPFEIPGSVYGAMGMCQFMPSNIDRFAVDGDGDGVVDLFSPSDAVASLSNYLVKHGWKRNMNLSERQKVLRRYNNLTIYANTILALAEKIETIPGRPTVNRPLPKGPEKLG